MEIWQTVHLEEQVLKEGLYRRTLTLNYRWKLLKKKNSFVEKLREFYNKAISKSGWGSGRCGDMAQKM